MESAYQRGESDEFIQPAVVPGSRIEPGDSVICFNFRPDRVRQITAALTQEDFSAFARPSRPRIHYVCLTEYDSRFNLPVAFPPASLPSQDMTLTLPELFACHHKEQLHAAETEKYAHVTYFFNGGREAPYPGEERILVPSLKVPTYDETPPMRTPTVCAVARQAIKSGRYPFIILNFANPDMVGHTGVMDAAVEAVETVDIAFGELIEATAEAKGTLVVTADHGNIEQMVDPESGQPHTAHTTYPVPFVLIDFSGRTKAVSLATGALADIAPTILDIVGLAQPSEMTGISLLRRSSS